MKQFLLSVPLLLCSLLMNAQSATFCIPEATATSEVGSKIGTPPVWTNVSQSVDNDNSTYASATFLSNFGSQHASITFNLGTTVAAGCSIRFKVGTSVPAAGAFLQISTSSGQNFDPTGTVPPLSGDYVGDTGPSDSDGFVLTAAASTVTIGLVVLGGGTYSGEFYVYDVETNCNCTVLPVTLISFTALKNNGSTQLHWSTSVETDNRGFEVQQSTDAKNWKAIGFVSSESTNSNRQIDYTFTDEAPETGVNYYKLKQIDLDGTFSYSPIKSARFTEEKNLLTLGANPASESINLAGNLSQIRSMKIADSYGRIMISNITPKSKIEISELPKGVYLLLIETTSGGRISKRFVKE
jgi:hypothetical protein